MDEPNPGSDEAIEKGCTCPVLDNNHGKGVAFAGERFWQDFDCPVHGLDNAIHNK